MQTSETGSRTERTKQKLSVIPSQWQQSGKSHFQDEHKGFLDELFSDCINIFSDFFFRKGGTLQVNGVGNLNVETSV